MNNLFISYDLYDPGQNYEKIEKAIKALGSWAKVHLSLYYVSTAVTASQAFDRVSAACDSNDKVIVIDATNAIWNKLSKEVSDHIKAAWNK
jgi:hypothetical protein